MKEIRDQMLLESYLQRFHIPSCFDTANLPFRLYEYAPGELLNVAHSSREYLKFVVEGTFKIYAVRPDGTYRFIVERSGFEILGDMEFCGYCEEDHCQEVVTRVRTVELPLLDYRDQLWEDNRFLRSLLRRIGAKLAGTSHHRSRVNGNQLEDILLNYLRHDCPDHRITSVDDTAFRLNYSRAQLQRVLRDLTKQGILKKQGKGTYQLAK